MHSKRFEDYNELLLRRWDTMTMQSFLVVKKDAHRRIEINYMIYLLIFFETVTR